MAWNDGISKELSEHFDRISATCEKARKIAEQVIDEEVQNFSERVESKIPINTGGLKRSYTVKRDTSKGKNWYGYSVSFEGNAPNGEPYEKIANILNYGTRHHAGVLFISHAVKRLKGMNNRINARIDIELDKQS